MKRFIYCLIGLLAQTCVLLANEKQPNILIILADDLGYSDIGCYGGEIKTPTLDELAKNGLRYSQFYNCARCWPTRASIMTGYYPQQVKRDTAPGLKKKGQRPGWAKLIPAYLKSSHYRSYHSGKWHIDGSPRKSGFDRSYCLIGSTHHYYPKGHTEDGKKLPSAATMKGYYTTVEITNRMISYLDDHQKRFRNKPFFAYLAYNSPHFPLQALPEDIKNVGNRYQKGWDAIRNERWQRIQKLGLIKGQLSSVERNIGPHKEFPNTMSILGPNEVNRPIPWKQLTASQKQFQQTKMTIHAAMVERIDKEIKRVIGQLKSMSVFKDTLIIFLSDNGASAEIMVRGRGHDVKAPAGSGETYLCLGPGWSTTSNTPLRRHKVWVHEGGINTPLIVHWPGKIAAKGEIRHTPGHVIDILPTILDLTGASAQQANEVQHPGRSIASTFSGEKDWNRMFWWHHEGRSAIRDGDWKLVFRNKETELFNLSEDRTESRNLSSKHPQKVAILKKKWQDYLNGINKIQKKR